MAYAKREDIELVFGKQNVKYWADADNNKDANTITSRINWALEYAEAEINSRIAAGPYSIPFSSPYPRMVILLTASLAGIYLYDTRRTVNADDPDRASAQRMNVERWVRMILAGQLDLLDPTTSEMLPKSSENSPFVVES